jgi:hypothetical protein
MEIVVFDPVFLEISKHIVPVFFMSGEGSGLFCNFHPALNIGKLSIAFTVLSDLFQFIDIA